MSDAVHTHTRRVAAGRLEEFFDCPAQYRLGLRRERHPPDQLKLTGDVVHRRTADSSPAAVQYQVERLQEVPVENRAAVAKQIDQIVEAAEKLKDEALKPDDQEKQYQIDIRIGRRREIVWTIFFKPDELFFFLDQLQNRVMAISETKAMALRPRGAHWDQLHLFAVLACLYFKRVAQPEERYRGAIKLTLKLPRVAALKAEGVTILDMGDGRTIDVSTLKEEHVRWYSPKTTRRRILELVETLERLEQAWVTNDFPETPGNHCWGCFRKEQCAQGRKFLNLPEPATDAAPTDETTPQRLALTVIEGPPTDLPKTA